MNCLRCRTSMVRVVNEHGTAHGRCARCSQWVECAECPACGNRTCLPCYNKAVAGKGPPSRDIMAPEEEGI